MDGRLSDAVRLLRLRDTGMLGRAHPSLDRLARAAAQQLHCSGALVSLVGADRRTTAGRAGTVPRHSFCGIVVDTDAPLLICDAHGDERIAGHPAAGDGVVAYAGFPVRSADGYPLGAFAVLDTRPRDWEPRELLLVEDLAAVVESELALRATARTLAVATRQLRGVLDQAKDAYVAIDSYGTVTAWNAAAERLFGYRALEAVGRPVAELIIPERFQGAHAAGLSRLHTGTASTLAGERLELTARNRSGAEFPVEMTLQDARDDGEPAFHAFLHDISDRVEDRRRLEHDRTFLQALLDSVDVGVAACDPGGGLTQVNHPQRSMHGTDPVDLYGPDGRTPLAPDEVPLVRALAGQRVDRQEVVVARPGAGPRVFEVNGRPIETPDGRRLGAVVAMHEVTGHRRTEMLRDLRLTVARELTDSHDAAEAAGRTLAAVGRAMGWAIGEFWQTDDEDDTLRRTGEWIADGHDLTSATVRRPDTVARGTGLPGHIWASGAEMWVTEVAGDPRTTLRADDLRAAGLHSAIGVPVRSAGRILGVLLFLSTAAEPPDPEVLDLVDGVCAHLGRHVERRRADDLTLALAAARRDFDRVIERVEDYVWTVEILPDRSLGRIYTSPNVHGIYGGPLPRVEDMGARVHPDDRPAFDEFNERVRAGEPAENEVRLIGVDGVTRWVWTRAMPRTENGRNLIDGICTNVTERRELRERLLAEQRARNDLKDELVALVSHELRNPLGAIRSYGETLLDDPELSPEQRHLAEVIDRRGAHMQALIDDLLDLARVEAGRLHLEPAPMSAARLIRDVVQTQEPAAAAKSLTLTVDLPADLGVRADPVRLRQVLDNLVANAVKYTPDGGRVTVAGRPGSDGAVVITVADTGIGIPAEEYPRLFDRFFRAANALDQGIPGTGLGLAISRAIVEAHGGTLDAAPAGGGGTVFTVQLP